MGTMLLRAPGRPRRCPQAWRLFSVRTSSNRIFDEGTPCETATFPVTSGRYIVEIETDRFVAHVGDQFVEVLDLQYQRFPELSSHWRRLVERILCMRSRR